MNCGKTRGVNSYFVFYHIACSRGVEVLVELLGEAFAGILLSLIHI